AAYAARYVAKNIVAAGLAARCEVQVSYAIGVAEPTSISVTTFGTGQVPDDVIEKLIRRHFDLHPYGITRMLDLEHPIYQATAAYGHCGRMPQEISYTDGAGKKRKATAASRAMTARAEELRKSAKLKYSAVALPPPPARGVAPFMAPRPGRATLRRRKAPAEAGGKALRPRHPLHVVRA